MSSGWLKEIWNQSHPDDIAIGSISFGWLMANVLSHPDDKRSFHKSSGWNDVGWILCHPDEIAPGRISSRILMSNAWCHSDVIRMRFDPQVIKMTQLLSVSHPDDLWTLQHVTRMTYNINLCNPEDIMTFEPQVIRMSLLQTVSHLDDL